MGDSIQYQERFCAYVDILGFRRLVETLGDDVQKFTTLRGLLEKVHSHGKNTIASSDVEIRSQSISDAVALSTDKTGAGLAALFDALETLSIDLLCQGYFLRGAIVRGRLYHDDHMIFGDALVRAWTFENEIARYPRIIVPQEVRNDMLHFITTSTVYPKMDRLKHAEDGPMYLDILQPVIALFAKHARAPFELTSEEQIDHRRYVQIREKVQDRYGDSLDFPRHFEKVRWFVDYWNSKVQPTHPSLGIRGAG